MEIPKLLIVDDERTTREGLNAALEEHFDIYLAQDLKSAMRQLEEDHFDVVLTDLRMADKEDGLELIRRAKAQTHPPICILMTAYGSEDVAVEAMKEGADDYISKGRLQIDELEMRINRALKHRNLEEENTTLHHQLSNRYGLENVVGESPALLKILDVVHQVAPTRATVLLCGESGTGKEVIAKAIHQLSPRARGPMITVHCAALNANLLESELFGHEKGAFTGANERRIGRFEQANGGTLFLDEIGEIDASTQIKLLRFLGEHTFERVGSNRTLTSDVRVIAATNKDLEQRVKEEKFREDLFFRLRVVEIVMPPLRERVEDIPLIATKFLKEFSRENGKSVTQLSRASLEQMQRYPWPGNVRELRAAIEYAVIFATGPTVQLQDLPPSLLSWHPTQKMIDSAPGTDRGTQSPRVEAHDDAPRTEAAYGSQSVKDTEKQLIMRVLEECLGNRTLAAQKLEISRRTLHRKLHEYGLVKKTRASDDEK